MFTGLVEALGVVREIASEGPGCRLLIEQPHIAPELAIGESVAVNGCCLTVVETAADLFCFQAGPETLARTDLGNLGTGDRVNLERALRVGDRLGGHWVQGHVDGLGTIASRQRHEDWEIVQFQCPDHLTMQMVPKGSVAVDGVSLTLVNVEKGHFSVMLIPHTLASTTLGFKAVGDPVNLETDVLGKYLWKWYAATR